MPVPAVTHTHRAPRYSPAPSITESPANPLYAQERACTACQLHLTCTAPVPGVGDVGAASVMVVLEAPAENEDRWGVPATGATGEVLGDLLRLAGLSRDTIWLSNAVKCQPLSDPRWADADTCWPLWFPQEVAAVRPKLIVACGQLAIRRLLNNPAATVEETHGRLHALNCAGVETWVLPTYHPAAGFYNPKAVRWMREDWALVGRLKGGKLDGPWWEPIDSYQGHEQYEERALTAADYAAIARAGWCAVDTEVVEDAIWSVQVSWAAGQAVMVKVADPAARASLTPVLDGSLGVRLVFHNEPYDAPKLLASGFPLALDPAPDDTLLAARLLESESAGLKALATRLLGVPMEEYAAVVEGGQGSAWAARVARYLLAAYQRACSLPDPAPAVEALWDKQLHTLVPRWKKAQPLARRLTRLHKDWLEGKVQATAAAQGKSLSLVLRDRWRAWPETAALETDLGPFPVATLADCSPEAARAYACRDSDVTGRLLPLLTAQLREAGLWDAYCIDRDSLPLVVLMQHNGIRVDVPYLRALAQDLECQQLVLLHQLYESYDAYPPFGEGNYINPGSDDQVGWLLYEHLGLPVHKRTPVKQAPSTDDGILARLKHLHPAVDLVLAWRELDKARTVYCEAMPEHAGADGRIRCDLGGATATGRIAAKEPNLLAVSNRGGLGKRVRKGLVPQ